MARSYARRAREERPRVRIDDSGGTRALLVDETFASFYRPGEIATHCVWDAVAAPILWLSPKRRRRILILGLGGGSVARLARALAPDAEIVGVEFDPEVVRLARRHLELDSLDVRVVIADAFSWLKTARGRFDAILEDIFVGHGDAVHKPDWIPEPGHRLARARLARGGVFVSNTLDEHAEVARAMRAAFPALVTIGTEDYDNRVLVAGSEGLTGIALRRRVADSPILAESLGILSFRSQSREGTSGGASGARRE
jgi:predicted O-methyltransferase YrrM